MNENSSLKILSILAFIAFAGVSCWATAESLHLLLDSWPIVMCWIVTVGFFIIASIGTKLIVDSLNKNIYQEKRGLKFIGGLILVVVFWLICSMPTNTHTFFYRTVINNVTNNDILCTTGYLAQIKENTRNKEQAELKVKQLQNDLEILLGELEAEIKNDANPGFGEKAEEIFRKFAKLLDVAQIQPLNVKAVTPKQRQDLCDAYRKKMYLHAETKARNIMQSILVPSKSNLKEAVGSLRNLNQAKEMIASGVIDLNDTKDVKAVSEELNTAYNVIKKNEQFVNFKSETDKAEYTANSPITKVKRLISVFDAWEAFLKGEFAGHGFGFWIIISILVDIAAFIFFDIAFKKRDF